MLETALPERFEFPSPAYSKLWGSLFGKAVLQYIGKPSDAEVHDFASHLMQGDPLADDVAELLKTRSMQDLQRMVGLALEQGIANVNDAPDALKKLFEEVEHIPDWVNQEQLKLGSEVQRRAGALGGYVLRNFALMGGYQSSAINKPLVFTGSLDSAANNRIAETNGFWVDITREGGLQAFAPGVKTAIRVRIMHALLRVRIQRNPEWDNNKWGLPINQADMLATNLAFSSVFSDGVRLLGMQVSRREAEAVLHFWKYVGYLLGINIDTMPETENEARRLLYKLTIAQPGSDEDCRHLAQALLYEPLDAPHPKPLWMRQLRVKFHQGLNRYFLDRHTCKELGIGMTPWVLAGPAIAVPTFLAESVRRLVPGATGLAVKLGGSIQDSNQQRLMNGKQAKYQPVDKLRGE